VEVMALGVPLIASPEAIFGMDFIENQGIFTKRNSAGFFQAVVPLLEDHNYAARQSIYCREQVETLYDFHSTYERLASELVKID
jgi:hypothetical protein